MKPTRIAPSILSADFAKLGQEVAAVQEAGADLVHVDVMDGRFVPNITIGPLVVRSIRPLVTIPLDVHLMIAEPDRYLEAFARAGADILTIHVEACPHLHRSIQAIRELGCRAGVALNPATPACMVEPVLPDVDLCLVMTVNPGFGGQRFIESTVSKIQQINRIRSDRHLTFDLEVDGGIAPDTIAQARRAGADLFVAGSAVFDAPPYGPTIETLRKRARDVS